MKTIRVMVVDDHLLFREGLEELLGRHEDLEVVSQAGGGRHALDLAKDVAPDVVLMDLDMPGMDGIEACRRLKAALPGTRIVILTAARDPASLMAAIRAGASGYLTKDTGADELVDTIRRVYHEGDLLKSVEGDQPLDPLEREGGDRAVASSLFATLSPREAQILKLLARGMANKEIAAELTLSEHTVRNHISSIFQKLQVNDRTEAAVMAVRQGWA